ncbi:MAG: hypothetical protein QOI04_512 [Verrucomicrobiota bacterium]
MRARLTISAERKLEQAARAAIRKYLHKIHPRPHHAWRIISPHPAHNVVGVAVGRKRIKNRNTSTPCVRIYVRHKFRLPRGSKFALPKKIAGVPTDIIAVGTPRHIANGDTLDLKRERPAYPGCWITAEPPTELSYPMPGTFGALLIDDDGALYILSNNHVLANEDQNSKGDLVYQPINDAPNKIAKLAAVIPLDRAGPNKVDCALAKVLQSKSVSGVPPNPIGALQSAVPLDPQPGMKVEKFGAATGHTIGTVASTSATFKVDYMTAPGLLLEEQIQIENGDEDFCAHGDSGSLIVDVESKQAVGLLTVNMDGFALANRLSNVVTALSAKLGSPLQLKIS